MYRLNQPKSGTMILLLFLTTQILLPAFCCCSISSAFASDDLVEPTCPSCVSQQSQDSLTHQATFADGSHDCPCKPHVAKHLTVTTKATVQIDLTFSFDLPLHNVAVLEIVADLDSVNQARAGPTFLLQKSSQPSQSFTCCWLC